jgi:ubiquinone/menaquinone biosynthesis C-methylase UbiE
MTLGRHWEAHAESWAAWARAPGHDSYWTHSGPPFFALLPPPGRATIDIGCGEGRVARDLKKLGHHVTGVDAASSLIRVAQEADPEGEYVVADAAALPFEDETFDVAIAFNSLMDMDDLDGAAREAARVLEHGGRFCVCIVHPVAYAGDFESPARFVIHRNYLETALRTDEYDRNGLKMTFTSWTRPLESYSRAFEQAGFVVERLREPSDPAGKWSRIPNFLLLRLIKF